ncbi:hypothetical protein [Streptomyces sp. CC224B]|uniref:hypothetical protein n=1 Tax=Streptomyces sp. CC224B TaxID=3044571 RepID=UPI0024A9ABE5|nr:hypothetical protein [Streptomyces sp. CC224B]
MSKADQGAELRLLRARGGAPRRRQQRPDRFARITEAETPGSTVRYIETGVREKACGLQGADTCTHPKARPVIKGTRPLLICTRRRTYPRLEVSSEVVISKLVSQPGTRPNHFLARALRWGR